MKITLIILSVFLLTFSLYGQSAYHQNLLARVAFQQQRDRDAAASYSPDLVATGNFLGHSMMPLYTPEEIKAQEAHELQRISAHRIVNDINWRNCTNMLGQVTLRYTTCTNSIIKSNLLNTFKTYAYKKAQIESNHKTAVCLGLTR